MRRASSGFTLFEFAVSAALLGVLATVLLARVQIYQEQAERVAVEQVVATLRTALAVKTTQAHLDDQLLRQLLEANPLELLERKPENYVGEYYAPDLEKIPHGNWLFDRRDKCLIYLVNSHKSFYFNASNLLKFKVELAQLPRQATTQKQGTAQAAKSVMLVQIEGQADAGIE